MLNQLHILYAVSLLMDMAVAGLMFAISRRAAELGASAAALGLLGATWQVFYVAASLISGRLSVRVGRRNLAVVATVVTGVIALLCGQTTKVGLLVVLTAMFGFGLGFFWPPVIAWVGDGASGAQLHRRLTWFGIAWNIGLLLGFALTGWVFRRWLQLAFDIPTVALSLIALLLLLPARQHHQPVHNPVSASTAHVGAGFRRTAWLANFGVRVVVAGVAALFPQLATQLGIPADAHGGLLAVVNATAIVVIVAMELLVFWRTRLWPLWLVQALCALAAATIGLGHSATSFLPAFAVIGLAAGYSYQASIFFTLEEMTEKGKGSGVHEAFLAGGLFVGPLLAGWAGNQFGLRAPYFCCAATLLAIMAAQIAVVILQRREYFGARWKTNC
ncbi:MAG: MFS transporter [Verrucomicrobiae bacterium]|nr:MFS transporter [Verrucomicrobiae bacterium]